MTSPAAGGQPRWWQRHPARLDYELQALREAGFSITRDEESIADGVMRLTLLSQITGVPERLVVTFPDLYPYFRFEIEAPDIPVLTHHQHPFTKNLCLLGRSTLHWNTTDTVASIIQEQMA